MGNGELQLDDLQGAFCRLAFAFGLGFALLAGIAFDGGAPAALGEHLLDRVHQVLAIEPGFEALGIDHAFGKQVGTTIGRSHRAADFSPILLPKHIILSTSTAHIPFGAIPLVSELILPPQSVLPTEHNPLKKTYQTVQATKIRLLSLGGGQPNVSILYCSTNFMSHPQLKEHPAILLKALIFLNQQL